MKIYLTGSTGTVGRALFERLAISHDVTPLNRLSDSSYLLPEITSDCCLLHFGAATPANCIEFDEDCYNNNVLQLQKLLQAFSNISVDTRVIFASSMSVYGSRPAAQHVSENTAPNNPSLYGLSKLRCEETLENYYRKGLISSYISLRLPGVLASGSAEASQNFLSVLLRDIFIGKQSLSIRNPQLMFNNILSELSLYVFIEHLLKSETLVNKSVNLASWPPIPLEEVFSYSARLFKWDGRLEYSDSTPSFTIDLEMARRVGFAPFSVYDSIHIHHRTLLSGC